MFNSSIEMNQIDALVGGIESPLSEKHADVQSDTGFACVTVVTVLFC